MPFPLRFVKRIGQCAENRWKWRFAQTGGIDLVLHEMYLYALGSLAVPDDLVTVQIALIRLTIAEGELSIHGISYPIHNGAFGHVDRALRVHHDAAINGANNVFHFDLAAFFDHIYNVGSVGVMAKISGNPPVHSRFGFAPFRIFLLKGQNQIAAGYFLPECR